MLTKNKKKLKKKLYLKPFVITHINFLKKLFNIKPVKRISFFTKKGIKIYSEKRKFLLFLNFNKKFKPFTYTAEKPLLYNLTSLFKLYHIINLKEKLILNKKIQNNFLLNFYNSKINYIQSLFTQCYYSFFSKLKQSQNLILQFPKILHPLPFDLTAYRQKIEKFFFTLSKTNKISFFNETNLEQHKFELAKILCKYFSNHKNLTTLISNTNFNLFLIYIKKKIAQRRQLLNSSFKPLNRFYHWLRKYRYYLKEKQFKTLYAKSIKKKEYATNYRLLKIKFKNSLTKFIAFKKLQNKKKKKAKKYRVIRASFLIHKLKTLRHLAEQRLFRKISLSNLTTYWSQTYKNKLQNFKGSLKSIKFSNFKLLKANKLPKFISNLSKRKIQIKLAFISKRLLKLFTNKLYTIKKLPLIHKLDQINAFILQINTKFKKFTLTQLKKTFYLNKKISTSLNFTQTQTELHNTNYTTNKLLIIKNNFAQFMNNNTLYNKMNFLQNLNVSNLLKNTSDILRADHFRSLLNKEHAFYEVFYKQQNPLKLLTTITGHNIYLTLFQSNPYKILWKASAGMLGLKHFRRAKKHQITFKDLILRCQLFMARNRNLLQNPLHLLIRNLNYHGTKNFLSFFLNQKKTRAIFENYKYLKIYNFYKQAPHLWTNYTFQFMSMIWARFKNNIFYHKRKAFNKILRSQRSHFKSLRHMFPVKNYFIDLDISPSVKKFIKTNPFII